MSGNSVPRATTGPEASANAGSGVLQSVAPQDDTIYQNGQPVAKTLEVEVDLQAREIRFGELYESDRLVLPDECEFQKYNILIQKIAFASRLDTSAPHKGRVLRGVVAEILRYKGQ
jgi:hypothetical protein